MTDHKLEPAAYLFWTNYPIGGPTVDWEPTDHGQTADFERDREPLFAAEDIIQEIQRKRDRTGEMVKEDELTRDQEEAVLSVLKSLEDLFDSQGVDE